MASSTLVKSLTRLYESGKLSKEQIAERVEKGTITPDDYEQITGEACPAATASLNTPSESRACPDMLPLAAPE